MQFRIFIQRHSRILFYTAITIVLICKTVVWNFSLKNDYATVMSAPEKSTITVRVSSVPSVGSQSVSFSAKVIKGARLSNGINVKISDVFDEDIECGDVLRMKGTFAVPDISMNYTDFDEESYLKSKGLCAQFDTEIGNVKILKKGALRRLYSKRTAVSSHLYEYMPRNIASLADALVTGNRDKMPDSLKDSFRHSGVYHIVAVSGLHLNLFILFLSYIYGILPLGTRTKKYVSSAVTIAGCIFMYLFTGFGISVQRAAIMAVVLCVSQLLNRRYSPITSLAAAMYITLFIRPYAYCSTSFQLSFLSTYGVIKGVEFIQKHGINKMKYKTVLESLVISCFSWICTFPVTAVTFHEVSIIALISNLIIVPIVPVMLSLSYLLSAASLFMPAWVCMLLSRILYIPAIIIIGAARQLSSVEYSYVPISSVSAFLVTLSISAILLCLYCRKSKNKIPITAVSLCIVLIVNGAYTAQKILYKRCTIDFINIGQGDCTFVRTSCGKTILIDAGSDSITNPYKYIVQPFLNSHGVKKVDYAIVTHHHADHINAIIPLLEKKCIKHLVIPNRYPMADESDGELIAEQIFKTNVDTKYVLGGDTVKIDDDTSLDILSPFKGFLSDANNMSLVFKLNALGRSILFTGDIEEVTQYRLLEKDLHCDIVKVPHHGSYSIIGRHFAERCDAGYAVISCGVNNRYSHPAPKTLKDYKDCDILRTDKHRTITFTIDKKGIHVKTRSYYKEENNGHNKKRSGIFLI